MKQTIYKIRISRRKTNAQLNFPRVSEILGRIHTAPREVRFELDESAKRL